MLLKLSKTIGNHRRYVNLSFQNYLLTIRNPAIIWNMINENYGSYSKADIMEAVLRELASLEERCEPILSRIQREKSHLYCEGLKAKLTQTLYALDRVIEFNNRSDETESTTDDKSYSITLQVSFYCDSFWTFLYSSLDVLSQIVNQTMNLGLDEQNASFSKVKDKLQGNRYVTTKVSKAYKGHYNSFAYRNLKKYRNCSNHRREIFIEEISVSRSVKRTSGYTTTSTGGSSKTVTRILCDDPLTHNPKIKRQRKVPDYMIETKEKIEKFIAEIVKAILPIR